MRVRRVVSCGAAALLCGALALPHASAEVPSRQAGAPAERTLSASATSSMSRVREGHVAVPLADGRVLVAGGRPGDAAITAEVFDPKTGKWALTKTSMLHGHDWPVASPLCDGRVLVLGKISGGPMEVEIYDPVADEWSDAGTTQLGHLYGAATLLADCRVLLSGGYSANTQAEIYDPAKGTFKLVLSVMASERFFHTATLLADGRVLVAGGGVDINGTWQTYGTADVFDPETKVFTHVKPLHRARRLHTATLLPDGHVLVAGGLIGGKSGDSQGPKAVDTAEFFDPAAGTWTILPVTLVTPRGVHTAALVPSGAVLLFGGLDATGSATSSVEGYFEGAFTALDPLLIDRFQHAGALLDDGRALLVGGTHQATAEFYGLAQPGQACGSNLACASGHCVGGLCCDEACDAGCRRCDVPGKEGTCSRACADATHASVCPDGGTTCHNEACVAAACSPLQCDAASASCTASCRSIDDCAAGYVCDFDGRCVTPPDVSGSDADGCATAEAPGGKRAGIGGEMALLLAAAVALARRVKRA